jgi:hypothetical protein
MRERPIGRLTEEQVELVLVEERPVEDPTLRDLAALVDAARELYLEPAPPELARRQMATLVAESRPPAPFPGGEPPRDNGLRRPRGASARGRRLGFRHPRIVPLRPAGAVALAAVALALAVAGVLVLAGSGDQPTHRVSDRAEPGQVPDRAVPLKPPFRRPAQTQPHRDDTPRARSEPRERPSVPPRSAPVAPPPVEPEAPLPVEPEPPAQAEQPVDPAPPVDRERPVDPQHDPAPDRSYGGPDSEPAPLKGPLDTERPIPLSP